MDTRDRLEALRRIPEYQDDFKKWRRLAERVGKRNKRTVEKDLADLKAHEATVRDRWKIRPPLPSPPGVQYDGWDECRPRPLPLPIFTDEFSVNVIEPNSSVQLTLERMIEGYDPFWYAVDYKKTGGLISEPKMKHKGGKHLCMTVDLSRTETELLQEFKGCIKHYQKMLPKKKTRNTEVVLDIWDIHNMVHLDGLNLTLITQKVSGWKPESKKGGLFDDSEFKAKYAEVDRAYKRACKMITSLKK